MKKISGLSVVFPTFNDQESILILLKKTLRLLPQITDDYEIVVVNDGSKDKTGEVLEKLKKRVSFLKVVNHKINLGYGAALADGFKTAKKDFIFYTDGDGQYDVRELKKLAIHFNDRVEMVTGYKTNRADPCLRKITGLVYNSLVKSIFGLKVRDVDCDFRLFRAKILKGIKFTTKSGAFDVELVKNLQDRGVKFVEVPVSHHPRLYGHSEFFNFINVGKTVWELIKLLK